MTVGDRIKQKRLEMSMSQEELAKRCGYKSRSSINKIELSRDLPLKKAQLIASVLNCEPSYLLGWDDDAPKTVENADALAMLMKDSKLLNYVKIIQNMSAEKKETLYSYIDFLNSSNH